ncbi:unnamed protein product [Amaranthus hypochondriacus]
MAASTNPSGNHNPEHSSFNGGAVASTSNGNSGQGIDNSGTASAMKHNPGIAIDWTTEEKIILETGLTEYASISSVLRYAKIAMKLPGKTVRDVALRAKWMNKKESNKRRKEDHAKKSKEKREKVTESSSKSSQLQPSRPGAHPYHVPEVQFDDEDGISYDAIGGEIGELLEQNKQYFQQISANFSSYKLNDNVSLLMQVRNNLRKVINNCNVNDTPEIMKQMPPLPAKLNEEQANMILPHQ